MFRVGIGFDVHRFAPGRDLILGGIKFNHPVGLAGHSDADVLIHAIMDALLGAAGLGDIGQLFPDNDEQYRGISSLSLLAQAKQHLNAQNLIIANIDSVVICESPRISEHRLEMVRVISKVLEINDTQVNIKGTTTEGLGFTGRREGIAAKAIALLEKNDG